MLACLTSLSLFGLNGELVQIEVDVYRGLPRFSIVGLPDSALQEARERVRSAIKNSGFRFPGGKVSVNLAPADLRKTGPRFDLAIALGIIHATGQIQLPENSAEKIILGELSFTGELRPIDGILPTISSAKAKGFTEIFVPAGNALEASLIPGMKIYPVETLQDICNHLIGHTLIPPAELTDIATILTDPEFDCDMGHIKGNEHAKRALEICAAGGHNCLMSGPPGSGKSMLAKSLATILPRLEVEESLEITKIHSIAQLVTEKNPIARQRPFRSVHHTASGVSIVGGGNPPKPGEISLSHRGVLFLDELPEFPQKTLEVLRQPLEDGVVTISRASGTCQFPARIMLVAAMNPCPCGFHGDKERECICGPYQVHRYKNKISGPLMDRIDLHIDVPRVNFEKMTGNDTSESSTDIRARVQSARKRQNDRFSAENIGTNAEMSSPMVKKYCVVREDSRALLKQAMHQMNLSGRAFYRILKLARTIADLADKEDIDLEHVAEAIQYRQRTE